MMVRTKKGESKYTYCYSTRTILKGVANGAFARHPKLVAL